MKAKRTAAALTAIMMALAGTACGSSDSSAVDIKPGATQSKVSTVAPDKTELPAETEHPVETEIPIEPEPDEPLTPPTTESIEPRFRAAYNDFAVKLLKQSAHPDIQSGQNAMVSPESVMLALGLAANGSDGNTLKQFEQLIGGGQSLTQINQGFEKLLEASKSSPEGAEFSIANSIWINEGFGSLEQSYLDVCKKVLQAEAITAPFNKETQDKMNGWVSEKTKGMIPDIIDTLDAGSLSVLINCIAFEGKWAEGFEDSQVTENDLFTNASGSEEKCTMLSSVEEIYLHDDKAEGFMKAYKGGRFAFAALLPNEGVSVAEYEQSLTGEKLTGIFDNRSYLYDVSIKLPEFKFDWGKSIADDIKAMGLTDAFSNKEADFTKLAKTVDGNIYLGDICHKTHIELDREGTKAAAATAIDVKCDAVFEPKEVKSVVLDRPFLFMIYDQVNDIPVFIGAVNTTK